MIDVENCINLELRKANRVLSQLYDGYLQECGLKTSQFSILRAVRFLKQTTNSELQEVLILDQTTLSRALKPLLREGLIQACPGVDKRQKMLSLTNKGRAIYKEALLQWEKAQAYVSKNLGEELKENLLKVSRSVVELKA
ncbi:MarR family winged helix-turn-helix transcriptional regulator [Alkalimarinus coralli]|uniref:MarR family winged helix-turn-helix transcriptional regulator n=2 Tax=Alkalimarinus coralli TaxID=2935863 RepID=UPI00202B10B4|nr:MarR family winged helix-turn-helix transcriptional regulator [Alkalimarinus coralli]